MSNRRTAYSAEIIAIADIPDKDRIKYLTVKADDNEWQVIGDANFKIKDKVVYIEYDTIIPETCSWAEFLRKRCYSDKYRGFRIQAMKMAGLFSYGIVFRFSEIWNDDSIGKYLDLPVNTDFSEILGIVALDDAAEFDQSQQSEKKKPMTKFQKFLKKYGYFIWKLFYYRKPESSDFPSIVAIKTDETRIQNLTRLFETWQGRGVYVTVKVDGQSATFSLYKGKFFIASRNTKKYEQKIKKAVNELVPGNESHFTDAFIKIACKYSIPAALQKGCGKLGVEGLTLQGELAGPGIQKNHLGLKENTLYAFNLFNPKDRRYYTFDHLVGVCTKFNIPTVPFLEKTLFNWKNIEEACEYAKGTYDNGTPREGVVIRHYSTTDKYLPIAESGQNGCASFKIINPDFAVKN